MKVVVAIDQTDNRFEVLNAVLNRHWPKDVFIKILTVVEPFEWDGIDKIGQTSSELLGKQKAHAQEILTQARALVEKAHPTASVHMELRVGDPRTEVVMSATHWDADRIIIGAHGTSPNRLLPCRIGPVIARTATCSIELVRLKDSDEEACQTPIRRQKVELKGAV
jgi:nucleotide-binding universal stress UspA family protein